MTWAELCNDPKLQDLPYKIELNKAGQIIMSPTRNRHGFYASKIAQILQSLMGEGETLAARRMTGRGHTLPQRIWSSKWR